MAKIKDMSNLSKVLIGVVVLVLVFFVFNYFKNTADTDTGSLIVQGETKETVDAKYILNLLNKMNQVSLNDSIFVNQAFMRLEDNSVALFPQPISRENPFAPINSSEINSSATTTKK